jgi:hypothetical protein
MVLVSKRILDKVKCMHTDNAQTDNLRDTSAHDERTLRTSDTMKNCVYATNVVCRCCG